MGHSWQTSGQVPVWFSRSPVPVLMTLCLSLLALFSYYRDEAAITMPHPTFPAGVHSLEINIKVGAAQSCRCRDCPQPRSLDLCLPPLTVCLRATTRPQRHLIPHETGDTKNSWRGVGRGAGGERLPPTQGPKQAPASQELGSSCGWSGKKVLAEGPSGWHMGHLETLAFSPNTPKYSGNLRSSKLSA